MSLLKLNNQKHLHIFRMTQYDSVQDNRALHNLLSYLIVNVDEVFTPSVEC